MLGLNQVCDRYAVTEAENEQGEGVLTWPGTATTSDIPTRNVTVSLADRAHMQAIGEHYGEEVAYVFLFEHGTTWAVDDYIKWGSDFYLVLTVENPDKMDHHLEVLAVHVQGVTV